ncbi:MAG: IS1 family transposase [Cytophagaceae bacterium]|nr:MAG: IS1 family transposase [Cytophagaceae bacterium]
MNGSKKDRDLCAGGSPQHALQSTLLPAQDDDELELDEVWSYVGHKKRRVWLWFVQCKRTRQIVAWMPGERDVRTAQDVWMKVPKQYKHCQCFADGLEAYAHAIPQEQLHQQTKKEHTNHLERFNATLRGRVGRLTRKTLSFSKSYFMHIVHVRLFLIHYNQEQVRKLTLST